MEDNKTKKELRDENSLLFCSICKMFPKMAWKSRKSDLEDLGIDEFIAGISTPLGQATFRINNQYWSLFEVSEIDNASMFCDMYSTEEAALRILSLGDNIKMINEKRDEQEKANRKIKK